MSAFDERAAYTQSTLLKLKGAIQGALGSDAERVLRGTCIYVVGSGGRDEMSSQSDADLFVARVKGTPSDVDAFQIRQAIARALFETKLPDPSQGGEFLKMHTAESLCGRMGTPEDDATNTLTARMLLLLESQPLLGDRDYERLVEAVISAYWKNSEEHDKDYQPYVLVNDIVRYWRILLLNYEAKNAKKERELSDPERRAERGLRVYKLRFSRCMTCFSVLARLLLDTRAGAVTQGHVRAIVGERPRQRLDRIAVAAPEVNQIVGDLLGRYSEFLERTSKAGLLDELKNDAFREARTGDGRKFGNAMFELIKSLGRDGRGQELFRHIVV